MWLLVKYETQKDEENKRESRNVGIEHVDHFRGLLHLFSAQQVKARIAMHISSTFSCDY